MMINRQSKIVRCEICGLEGLTQDELRSHRHNANQKIQCPICQVALASSRDRLVHVERTHLPDFLRNLEAGFDDEVYLNKKDIAQFSTETDLCCSREDIQRSLLERAKIQYEELINKTNNKSMDSETEKASKGIKSKLVFESDDEEDEEVGENSLKPFKNPYVDDGTTMTKNVISKVLSACKSSSYTVRVFGCSYIDHYGSADWDLGWGCGYRNLQMILSSLLTNEMYKKQLLQEISMDTASSETNKPSVQALQVLIEKAWSKGFDAMGARQLGNSLANTRKWIGATEAMALLSFLKLRCQLVDFHAATGAQNTHPEIFKWVLKYFENFSEDEFVPPLFLQHQGHSRVIVGVEEQRHGVLNLLILDPSVSASKIARIGDMSSGILNEIRVCKSNLRASQYQIVAVAGVIDTDEEYENCKVLTSIRIP